MEPVFNSRLCELYKWDLNSFLLITASFFGTKYVLTDEAEEKQDKTKSINPVLLEEKDLSPDVKFPLHTIILMCYASSCIEQILGKGFGEDLKLDKFKKLTESLENWATRMIDEMYMLNPIHAGIALRIDYREELRKSWKTEISAFPSRNGSQWKSHSSQQKPLINRVVSTNLKKSPYRKYLDSKYGKSKEIMAIAFKAGAMKFLSTKCCQNYIDCRYYGTPMKRKSQKRGKTVRSVFSAQYKLFLHTGFRLLYIALFSYMLCRFPTSNQSMLHSMTSHFGTLCWFIIIAVLGAQFFTTFIKVLDMMFANELGVSVNAEQPESQGSKQKWRQRSKWLNKFLSNNKLTFFRFCIIQVLFLFEVVRFVRIYNRNDFEDNWLDSVFVPILSEIFYCVLFAIAAISSLRYFQNILSLGFFIHLLKKMLKTVAMFILIFLTFWYVLAVIHVSISRTLMQTNNTFLYTVTSKGKFEVFGEVVDEDSKGSLPECSLFNRTILEFFDMNYTEASCLIRSSMIPFLLFVYMFVTGILLMNLLTAQLTKEYEKESENSKNYTGYLKYEQLSKIESKMILPPPFSWIYILLRLIALLSWNSFNCIFKYFINRLDGHAWGTVLDEKMDPQEVNETIEKMRWFMALKPESIWNKLKNQIDEYSRLDETDENIRKAKTELNRLIESRVENNRDRANTRLSHHTSVRDPRMDKRPSLKHSVLVSHQLIHHSAGSTPTPTCDSAGAPFTFPDTPGSIYNSCQSFSDRPEFYSC